MSEVKPTLVKVSDDATEHILPNSWRYNFPNARWSDANNRGYLWVVYSRSVIFNVKSYEFRIKFNEPVSEFFIDFPVVVKTSNEGVSKTFINNVEYNKRNKMNYGTGFVLSGLEFHFKVATRYKLSGRVYPIVYIYYNKSTFKNLNILNVNFSREVKTEAVFTNRNILYNAIININPTFVNVNRLIYKGMVFISPSFINVNKLITSLANCQNTTWERFGEVWSGCKSWAPPFFIGMFVNRNDIATNIMSSNSCEDTTWDRFGGAWDGCEVWTPPIISGTFVNINDIITSITKVGNCEDTTWDRFGGAWDGCEVWTL